MSSSSSSFKAHDLIVYGATGFTGKRIALEIAKNPPKLKDFSWTIAGRDASKLNLLLESLLAVMDTDICPKPAIVVVDVGQKELLESTIAQYRVCINCVGPFRLYGAPVVNACVAGKTDYVDICGETEFIEQTFADHNDQAISDEIAIIPACGYDSIPADIGALWAKLQFEKEDAVCTQSEMYVSFGSGPSGITVNATTFISAVLGFASVENLRALRRKTHRKLDFPGRQLRIEKSAKWNKTVSSYTVPAPVADVPVVRLGQQISETHRENYKKGLVFKNKYQPSTLRPIHFAGYFSLQSLVAMMYLIYIGILLKITSSWSWFQKVVIRNPAFFTFGVFTFKGPTEVQLSEGSFTQVFVSKGYKRHELQGDYGYPTMEIVTTCKGPEMGYVTTPACVVASASLLLNGQTRSRVPSGVLTPAVAFSNVVDDLVNGLKSRGGIEFSFVSRKDL